MLEIYEYVYRIFIKSKIYSHNNSWGVTYLPIWPWSKEKGKCKENHFYPPSQIHCSILIFIYLIYHFGYTASSKSFLPYQVFTPPPFYWLRFNISCGERGHGNWLSLRSRINRVAIFVKINCRHIQFRQLQQ